MRPPRTALRRLLAASLAGLVGVSLLGLIRPALAQTDGWTAPRLVFEGQGQTDWPTILADQYGAVHGLWTYRPQLDGNRQQAYYVRLDQTNWQPIDILSFSGPGASFTAQNWAEGLLVTWNGAQYGQAGRAPETSARAWRGPYNLGSFYFQPGLAAAPDGELWMAFGSQADKGIYVQQFDIETDSWATPRLVAYAINPNTAPDWARLAIGADGTLHVIWSEYQLPDGFPPVGAYYARSEDNGETWTTPLEAGPAGANQPDVVTGPADQVYLSWVGMAGVGGKYVRASTDGGLTWTDAMSLFGPSGGGSQGSVKMAVDSAGGLHAVVAHQGCVWHFFLEGETWSAGECISEGLPPDTLKEFPAMTLGLGNQLHVLFWTDRQQLWYVTRQLDVAGIEPQVLPTEVPVTPTVEVPTATPVPTATHLPDLGPPPVVGASSQAARLSILAGIVPVVVFFLVVGVVRVRGRK